MRSTEDATVRSESDEAAFSAFFRARSGAVLAFVVRRVADEETAREITADVFRIARPESSTADEPSTTWLLTVARNRIGDEHRRSSRERRLQEALEGVAATAPRARPVSDDRVEETLRRLSTTAREVLVLTDRDGLRAEEAAEVLGLTSAAVRVRLHRARRAFADRWRSRDE